jgi:uncharacterized membrane protein HdeD (DUF308 family)
MKNPNLLVKEIQSRIRNWWVLLLLGVIFIAMGFIVLANPLESYVTLAIFFAASMLVSGIFQIVFSIANREEMEGWGWQLALGIMETIIGFILIFNLGLTLAILPFYVGFWLLFRSFALIGFSFEMKTYKIMSWGYYLVFGILLAVFSWFIILRPVFGGITIVTWTAIAFMIAGVAHIMLSFRLKKVNNKIVKVEKALE